MSSAINSALVSRQASRSATPLPIQAPNPYRLPRFWRGYGLGVLSTVGAYGLYKLGSNVYHHLYDKFHRQPTFTSTPTPEPTPQATPEPTPYAQNRNIKLHYHHHV